KLLLKKMITRAVCPQSKLTAFHSTHSVFKCNFNAFLFVVVLHFIVLNNTDADNMILLMWRTLFKDHQLYFLFFGLSSIRIYIFDLEITLHIVQVETILFVEHNNY